MELKIHEKEKKIIAELVSEKQLINELEDAIDILGNADYLGANYTVIYKHQLHPDFFNLRSGLAGDVLQKFSNYRMKLAIIGDFSNIESKSLRDFIYESNKGGHVRFIDCFAEV